MNNDVAKIGAAVAGGYLLGRTKKGKAALGMALWLAGSRTGLQPRALVREGLMALARSPQTAELVSQLRGPVLEAGRRAAITTLETQARTLTGALQQRTALLEEAGGGAEAAGKAGQDAAGKAGKAGQDAVGTVGKAARGRRDEDESDEVEDQADEQVEDSGDEVDDQAGDEVEDQADDRADEEESEEESDEDESDEDRSPEASDESEQGDEEPEEPQQQEQPKRRSTRTRKPAGRAPQKRSGSSNRQKEAS
jgi:hypothetical protein